MAQLVACAPEKPEVMRKDIEDTIDTFQSEGLKKIVREMLRLTGDKLEWFPAAQRLHHAERSGLLHHTTSMLNLARHVVAAYPFLNAELLYAGVILHDLCKTTEMISDETGSVSDYSADGLLIGHLVRGVARIEEAAKNVGVSGEIVLLASQHPGIRQPEGADVPRSGGTRAHRRFGRKDERNAGDSRACAGGCVLGEGLEP